MPQTKENLRVIFMGTPSLSAEILRSLLDAGYNIVGVFTQPDKKVGRKQMIEKSPVKMLAEEKNTPIFTPNRLDDIAIEKIRELKPDLIILIAYGKILPAAVLELPKFGAINIHPSLLPKFRGPSPIQNALLNGEQRTGTTIMKMDAGIDTGDILAQQKTEISSDETYLELANKLLQLSRELLLEILPKWIAGEINPQKQNDSEASYCQMITKNDGKIDWNDSAENIYNKYRAFMVWPGIFTSWNSQRIKLNRIILAKGNFESYKNGEIFRIDDTICIKAGANAIGLMEIQLEGKPGAKILDFINGHQNFIGSILN